MKILIIGGGIGGLAAASFLEKKGFEVTLIERAPEFKNIGFSMSIFPNGRRMLRELGVDDEVGKKGYVVPWLEIADSRGHILGSRINMKEVENPEDEPIVSIERANLHESLVKNLKHTKILLGVTVEQLKNEKNEVQVLFSNGKKEIFDIVVAADGINSKIREDIFGHHQSFFYGWSLRFFWVPSHIPAPKGVVCLSKAGSTFTLYPTIGKCCVGIYEYNPKRVNHPPLSINDFLPYLTKHGWTQKHIDDISKEAAKGDQYYDHLRYITGGPWYKKRIVLLGDAKHGMAPITGMGGTMALEDAFVLADELAKVETSNIHTALENYSKRRTRRVDQVMGLSHFLERFYFIKSPLERFIRDIIMSIIPKGIVTSKLKKIVYEPI